MGENVLSKDSPKSANYYKIQFKENRDSTKKGKLENY